MKRLIWLLLIINVVLFAYFNLDYVSPNKPVVKLPELNSEKISLLTQQQLDLLPKKAGVMPETITMVAITPSCYEWGVFEDEKLAIKLMDELKAKGVSDVVKTLRDQEKGRFNLLFKQLQEPQVAEIKKLKSGFPEADLKQVTCN